MIFPPPTEKQARLIWLALTGLAMAALVALVGGLLWGMGKIIQVLSPVLWPVAVAGIIAFLLDPVVDFFQSKGLSRTRAIVAVYALTVVMLAAIFSGVMPRLVKETRQFVERVPDIVTNFERRFDELMNNPPPLLRNLLRKKLPGGAPPGAVTATNAGPAELTATNAAAATPGTNAPSAFEKAFNERVSESAQKWLAEEFPGIGKWLAGQIGTWFGILISLILVPVYAFYILVERYEIEKNWTAYLPVTESKFKTELVFILSSLKNYLVAFFRGQVLVAICEGFLYTIAFLIIGQPYALLLGASAFILTIVPFLGATILCIISFIVAVVQCGDWLHPLLVLVVVAIIQTLEALWISPRIMRGRVGLHPAIIIFAVMAGTLLMGGLLGGILAIPLAAMIKVMLSRYVWKRRVT